MVKKLLSWVLACTLIVTCFSGMALFGHAEGDDMEGLVDFTVEVESGRDIRVLQLTDTQIIESDYAYAVGSQVYNNWHSTNKDATYHNYVKQTVETYRPDLIIITGDLVYGQFDDSGAALLELIDFMDSFKIPWAPVFGNHDNESKKGADWQCDQLENSEYCLFLQRELTGNGNYTVGLKQDGKYKRVFFMLDSNGCSGMSSQTVANGHSKKTIGFGEDQIEWYSSLAEEMRAAQPDIKFSAAFHIQLSVFAKAYEKYGYGTASLPMNLDTLENVAETDFGYIGRDPKNPWDSDETVWNSFKNSGFDSIYVGHEHCNSASVVYEGVRLQYGQKSSTYDRANYLRSDGTIVASSGIMIGEPIIGGTSIPVKQDGSLGQGEIILADAFDFDSPSLYDWFDTDGGVLTGRYTTLTNAGDAPVLTEIPGVGGYGIKLDATGHWNPLAVSFDTIGLPADGRAVTLEIEYYITSSFDASDNRSVIGFYKGIGGIPQEPNLYTKGNFVSGEVATFSYTYSVEELVAMEAKGSVSVQLFPGDVAKQGMYIKSMRLTVAPEEEEGVYAWFDTDGGEITGKYTALTNAGAAPVLTEIPDVGGYGIKLSDIGDYWKWLEFTFDTTALPTDGRSVMLVMEYYITSSFTAKDNWPVIGFGNGLETPQKPNLTTKSFVNRGLATFTYTYSVEELVAMEAKGSVSVRLFPGDVAKHGMYIKSIRLVDTATLPYAWFENDGTAITGKYTALTNAGAAPVLTEIPDVGGYGIKLDTTSYWNRLDVKFDASGLPTDGRRMTLVMEYYMASSFSYYDNWAVIGFYNGVGDTPQKSNLYTKRFVNGEVGTFFYNYSAEEVAAIQAKGSASIMIFPGDVAKSGMWIKSMRLVDAPVVELECPHETTTVGGYVAPTCTAVGSTGTAVCDDCGEIVKEAEEIPATGHNEVVDAAVVPTCTEIGLTEGSHCNVCGEVLMAQEETDALGHSWDDGKVTKEPTATEAGVFTYTCTVCGETKAEDIAPKAQLGDVNGDNKINSTDARLVLQKSVGKISDEALNTAVADVNGDKKINSTDARLILQFSVGKIGKFPGA